MTYSADLRYPIGLYTPPAAITPEKLGEWIDQIAAFPARFRALVEPLTDAQLDTPYRPEGWTVRQVINHVPDSHLHSYVRFKWTLTEDSPTIKAYNEQAWAELTDSKVDPIDTSLNFLESIHVRWVRVLKRMTPEDWDRFFVHPESGDQVRLDWNLGNYVWHGNHHYGHIDAVRLRLGW